MAQTSIGPRIQVNGEEKYRADILRIIQQAKTLDSEMKKVTASFNANTSAEEKAAAKAEVLTKRIDVQRQRVEKLTEMTEKAKTAKGEDSVAALKWQDALNNAQAELAQLEQQLRENTEALNAEQDAEDEAAEHVDDFADATQKSSTALSAKAVIIGNIITSLAKQGAQLLREIGSVGLEYDRTMERYTKSLANSLGSTQAAVTAVANIKLDAKNAPLYSVDNLVRANQMLISTGESAEDARATIMGLSEAISATGGGNDELSRMASNLQQIKNAGKATAMDIRQFAYAGIDVYGILADYTGKTTAEVKELDVSYNMLSKAFQAAAQAGGRYYGANATQAATLNGQIAALSNTVKAKLGESFEGVAETLRDDLLPWANEAMAAIDPSDAVRLLGDLTTAAVTAGGAIYAMAKIKQIGALADDFRKAKIALEGLSKAEQAAALKAGLMNESITTSNLVAGVLTRQVRFGTAAQLAWNAAAAAFPGAVVVAGLAAIGVAVKKGVEAIDEYVETTAAQGESIDDVRANLEALKKQQDEMEAAARSGWWTDIQQQEYDHLRLAISATTERLAGMEAEERAAIEAEAEHAAYLETTAGKCDSLSTSLQELIQGYQEAYTAAQESLTGQFDLFEMASSGANLSTAEILAAMQSQADYFNAYAGNLDLLESLTAGSIGLNEELVARLNDGTDKSVQYAASLVAGYQQALAQGDDAAAAYVANINAAFDNQQAAIANAAQSMAASQTDLQDTLNAMVDAAKDAAIDMDQYKAMEQAAIETIQGYIDGLDASSGALYQAMSSMGANAARAFRMQTSGIRMPGGSPFPTGFVNGSHAAGLDYVPFDGYIAELHEGEMVLNRALAAEYRQSSTVNYGGIIIPIYAQPGQDVREIANEVKYILQDETARREAVFR